MAADGSSHKMPVLFIGHGSPMNAIEHNAFTESLGHLSARLPRPNAVCVVSAHWVTSGTQVLKSEHPRTIHDRSAARSEETRKRSRDQGR